MVLAPLADGQFGDFRLQGLKTRSPALPAEIDVLMCGWPAFPGAEVVRGPVEARLAEQALNRSHVQFPSLQRINVREARSAQGGGGTGVGRLWGGPL